jgi:2-phosphoglycerate kinase
MAGGIFLIAGASGAGKTTAARDLAVRHRIALAGLDAALHATADFIADNAQSTACRRQMATALCHELASGPGPVIVETSALEPEDVRQMVEHRPGRISVVFLGYPADPPEHRLRLMRLQQTHWSMARPDHFVLEHITRQIERSRRHQAACTAFGIPFFDTARIEHGLPGLEELFDRWWKGKKPDLWQRMWPRPAREQPRT